MTNTPKHEATDAMGMESQRDEGPLSGKSWEMKPCPFCSAPAKAIERSNPMSKWRWSVDCTSTTCGMSGPVEDSKQRAVQAWNRRATTQPAEQGGRDVVERMISAEREQRPDVGPEVIARHLYSSLAAHPGLPNSLWLIQGLKDQINRERTEQLRLMRDFKDAAPGAAAVAEHDAFLRANPHLNEVDPNVRS